MASKYTDDDDEEEDDEEYHLGDEFSNENSEEEEEGEEPSDPAVVLDGTLSVSSQGQLIYSGIWYMSHEAPSEESTEENRHCLGFEWTCSDAVIDLNNPLMNETDHIAKPKTFSFQGHFISNDQQSIQESDVRLTFSLPQEEDINSFKVHGTGRNDYGPFTITGIYHPRRKYCKQYSLVCDKVYSSSKRKYSQEEDDDDDEDEDVVSDDGDGNPLEELIDLYEDAKLPLEEVTQRYSSRNSRAVKRTKGEDPEEDTDQGCGF